LVDVAVSRRMGLFVVARLAARHGIRVRLRPAPTGGLAALVWLPDETVTYEGIGSPPTPRRLGRDRVGTHNSLDALSTLATPGPAQTAPVGPETAVPPAVTLDEGRGPLPIFESVESDWFRRSRTSPAQAVAAVDTTGSPSWTSAADEGWRAAEAVSKPTSGGVASSGLPKRVPQANLVPGTVRADGQATPQPSPVRTAAAARDRLASFQHGVQEARAAARHQGDVAGQGNGVT
jgi:hypothetical protein